MITAIFQILLLIRAFRQSEQVCNLHKDKSHLTCKDINVILDYHNEHRDMVATGKTKLVQAKNMWALKWDKELAKLAQGYANKCVFEHNTARPKGIGENLAWQAFSENKVGDIAHMNGQWYNEIKDYDPEGPFELHKTGHFTQMIWADTKYVGCGLAFYEDGTHEGTPHQTLLVCNYKPPGNVRDEKPYAHMEEGGTRCERGVQSVKFPGLCAHDQEHASGNYVPCSGFKLQPTAMLLFFFLLYGYYRYNF